MKSRTAKRDITPKLRTYLRRRVARTPISADDVHEFLNKQNVRKDARTRLSYINSVLSDSTFVAAGTIPSKRPAARGRYITQYVLSV